jgi:3-hydroxybutyryl-CoA dehydratase
MVRGKHISEIKIGDHAEFSKTITETDIKQINCTIEQFIPIHISKSGEEQTSLKERFIQRTLLLGLISHVLENLLPGPGTLLLSQDVSFPTRLRINDTIITKVRAIHLKPDKNKIKFQTICVNQRNMKVVDGTAWVMAPKQSDLLS